MPRRGFALYEPFVQASARLLNMQQTYCSIFSCARCNLPLLEVHSWPSQAMASRKNVSAENNGNRLVPCREGVMSEVPYSSSKYYVGQTGSCLNEQLGEHAASMEAALSGCLAVLNSRCGCLPNFEGKQVLAEGEGRAGKELAETSLLFLKKKITFSVPPPISCPLTARNCFYWK